MADSLMFGNPIIFALVTYGLTIVIAFMVAGIIWVISWAVKARSARTKAE
jgi:prepilin signal peptidase PulO-like enzyme (type II secretory pathway)